MSDFPPNLSIRPLTIEDIDQCEILEKKGFVESEQCTREKFQYRLTACPELCSGLFIREYEPKYKAINVGSNEDDDDKDKSPNDSESDGEELPIKSSVVKETLIGHIIATKTYSSNITEASMSLPSLVDPTAGHHENSRFIGIHSLTIDPQWRGKNLGTLLIHDYIQKLSNQDLGDRIVIIAHAELIPFYEKIGFNNLGESLCKFGSSTFYDMAIDLVPEEDD